MGTTTRYFAGVCTTLVSLTCRRGNTRSHDEFVSNFLAQAISRYRVAPLPRPSLDRPWLAINAPTFRDRFATRTCDLRHHHATCAPANVLRCAPTMRQAHVLIAALSLLHAAPAQAAGWRLVFEDNFDGTELDRAVWATRYIYNDGTLDKLNDEQERYEDHHNHQLAN